MPLATITDFVLTGAGKAGVYVQLRENAAPTNIFTSAAPTDSNGQFSLVGSPPPPADYTAYTSPMLGAGQAWTVYDPHYRIAYTKNDDAILNTATFGASGKPWIDLTHPTYGCVGDGVTDAYTPPAGGTGLPGWILALLAVQGVGFIPSGKVFRTSRPIQIWQASGVAQIWLMGTGMTSCGFTVLPADYGNFVNDYVFTGPGPSWVNSDVKFTDFKIDGQSRNSANPAARCGGISFGARTVCERVLLDDINWLAWSMRNTSAPDSVRMIDCQSKRGPTITPFNGSDNISGGFNLSNIQIIRHIWDVSLSCLSAFDFVPAQNVKLIDCTNFSALSIILEAMTQVLIIGLIALGGGGVLIQSDQGYAFPAGTTNCSRVMVTECILFAATIVYGALFTIQASICVNFGKGGAATVLGYGISIDHNEIIQAPTNEIVWLNNDSTYSSGGNSCDHNTCIDGNTTNTQVGINILGTSTSDGGVGIFFAHGGSPSDTALGNKFLNQGASGHRRHWMQFGQTNGGAASVVGAGLYIGLDNRGAGAAATNYYVPGTLISVPSVRGWASAINVSGAQLLDPSIQEDYYWILNGNFSLSAIPNALVGMRFRLWTQQDGAGGRVGAYDASMDFNWQPVPTSNDRSMLEGEFGADLKWHQVTSAAYDQRGNLYVVGHITTASAVPALSNPGANCTNAIIGNDTVFDVQITVAGGGLAANTRIATVTYAGSYGPSGPTAPLPAAINQTSGVGLAAVVFYTGAEALGGFDLFADQALVAGVYHARCIVIGRK